MNLKQLSLFLSIILFFLGFLTAVQAHQQRDSYFAFTQKYIYYSENYAFNNVDGDKLSDLGNAFFYKKHQDEDSVELASQMTLYNNTLSIFSTYYNNFYAELAACNLKDPAQAAQLDLDQKMVISFQTDYFLMKNGLLKFAKALDEKRKNSVTLSSGQKNSQ